MPKRGGESGDVMERQPKIRLRIKCIREAQMPRYYFDVLDGTLFHDEEGDEFSTPEAAKEYARKVAHELACERTDLHDSEVVVRDEVGECFRLKVASG
jgi:hypothetical protein